MVCILVPITARVASSHKQTANYSNSIFCLCKLCKEYQLVISGYTSTVDNIPGKNVERLKMEGLEDLWGKWFFFRSTAVRVLIITDRTQVSHSRCSEHSPHVGVLKDFYFV